MLTVSFPSQLVIPGGALTTNRLPKASGATTVTDSLLSDDASNVTLTSGGFLISTNDQGALGSATASWSDLFLASGGVINWANGNITLTHATGTLTLAGASGVASFAVNTANAGGGSNIVATNANNTAAPAYMILRGSRGTIATPAASQNEDQLGWLSFRGHDGAWKETALIGAIVDGTTGSGDLPTRLSFYTTPDASATAVERWRISPAGHWLTATDNAVDIGAVTGTRPKSIHVAAPAITSGSGTGLTVAVASEIRRVVHKVTVTYAALAAAGLTADKVIATLQAKTRLVGIIADTTTPYTGGGVTAASLIVGKTTGGNEYLVTHDVLSATITRGLADAELGTSINRANAIQAGDLPSWTANTDISVRLTTVTANTDQLTAGSTTYYLITEAHP